MSSIYAKPFPDPPEAPNIPPHPDRLGRLFGSVFRKWRRQIDNELRDLGFSDATRSPLIGLYDHEGAMRQRDLADYLGLDPSALVRIVGILEKRELVTFKADPADKRSKLISLTPNGRRWAEFIISRSYALELQFLATVGKDELATVRGALRKILANIPDG